MAITTINSDGTTSSQYVGLVLDYQLDRNYPIMSDEYGTAMWAICWNEEKNKSEHVLAYIEGYQASGTITVTVDASTELFEKYYKSVYDGKYSNTLERLIESEVLQNARIEVGDVVKVYAGRKHKGVTGRVFHAAPEEYSMGFRSQTEIKLGIALSEKKKEVNVNGKLYMNYEDVAWVWEKNCAKLEVKPIDLEALEERARNEAQRLVDYVKAQK